MTLRRVAPSTESLWRAFLHRCLPTSYENSSFGVDLDSARVLVADGVAQPAVRVLGRTVHTLQGIDIAGAWAIEASLDGSAYSPIMSEGGAGTPAADPTATLVLSSGGCPPSAGGEMVVTAIGAGAPGNAFTVEVVWGSSSSVDFTDGHLLITLDEFGFGDVAAPFAAALIEGYGGGEVFAVAYDDAAGLVAEQTVPFSGGADATEGGAPVVLNEDGFTTVKALAGWLRATGGSGGSILMASAS